jgi:hypothetical protein
VPHSGKQSCWTYLYDFGDGWRHQVVFEGCGPVEPRTAYPRCFDGARACPPEDCGGPWGYADLLEVLAGPRNKRYKELVDWLGAYDPEAFDAKRATSLMRRYWRFCDKG